VITDVFAKAGLDIPRLTRRSYDRLASFFSIIGGSYQNPFDISSTFLMADDPVSNLANMLDVMDKDSNIDSIALELFPVIRRLGQGAEIAEPVLNVISEFNEKSRKPFIVIVTAAYSDALAAETRDQLLTRGIHSYINFERAAKTMKKLADYYQTKQGKYWN